MARKRVGRNWSQGIKSTADVADKRLNILLWGESGTGKTRFMGGAPKPFIIAAEDGVLTLANKEIPYYLLQADEKIYDTVLAIIDDARKKQNGFENIESICVDSLWKLNEMLMDEILDDAGIEKPDNYSYWGILQTRISKIMGALLSLDYHIIASVGEKVKEDKLTGGLKPVFNFSGSYADHVAYEFDFNLYLVAKSRGSRTEYLAYSKPENKRTAKSRVELPREIKDLSFDYIRSEVLKVLDT